MPPRTPARPGSKDGSDHGHDGGRAYRRLHGTNSAPPFSGSLPIRLNDAATQANINPPRNNAATQTNIRLPRITEMDNESSPSENRPAHGSYNLASREAVTPMKRDPDDTETDPESEEVEDRLCEFSTPCKMDPSPDGMHYRKVVSHVFGRNKASTKLFPEDIWVHYCRKHYQRARYRAEEWPFTQCDLLLESLSRMEKWGGVESFELTLRRREVLRVEEEEIKNSPQSERSDRVQRGGRTPAKSTPNKSTDPTKSTEKQLPSGRKKPIPIIAPVPHWMLACLGKGKSFNDIRYVIDAVNDYMRHMSAAKAQAEQKDGRSASSKGKKPATPQKQDAGSAVRFPDIEILPSFKPWVHAEAQKKREAQGQGAGRASGSQSKHPRCHDSPPPSSPTPQTRASRSRNNRSWRDKVNDLHGTKDKKR